MKKILRIAIVVIFILGCAYVLFAPDDAPAQTTVQINEPAVRSESFDLSTVPEYIGVKSYTVNNGNPYFTDEEIAYAKQTGAYENYGEHDSLGRCTAAMDNLSRETMPVKGEQRESIREIKPSGWKQAFYDCVDNESVMTRTHLVGWMLSAENANDRNLISGTRYMNSDAMTTLELATARYIENGNGRYVLYRVTPIYEGKNLMASGVLMEGLSLNDGGNAIRFCEYLYNVQPGLVFDYSTGKSEYSGIFFDINSESVKTDEIELDEFILDLNTIHEKNCEKTQAKVNFYGDISMISVWPKFGYSLCECVK